MTLRHKLLRWYDRHRRQLPWRESRDPYRIWVSEVMLQQTRVRAVLPFYEKFLRLFPDIESLAAAEEQSLLACWSGLGYYSRARNLRKAAQAIVREWGGQFPRDYEAALRLPGVGDYTARAVLSIAYGIPLAVLDGNVARVLSRLYAVDKDFRSPGGKAELLQLAEALLSRRRPGDFNQAMMELGATICLPKQPQCPDCPARASCLAYLRNEVEKYPPPRRQAKPTALRLIAAVILDGAGRCLLVRRPPSARWLGGFWELPMWNKHGSNRRSEKGIALGTRLGSFRHSITSNQLEVTVYEGRLERAAIPRRAQWTPLNRIDRLPITTITRKALSLRQ